jgi:hypothetical protein
VSDNRSVIGNPAAIAGIAGTLAPIGVVGSSIGTGGTGVIGLGNTGADGIAGLADTGVGVIGFSANNADLLALRSGLIGMVGHLASGPPAAGTYVTGDLIRDEGGQLFVCVNGGSPGTWRKLAGPSTAGAFDAIAPARVYDSRGGGKTVTNQERVVSVATNAGGDVVVPAGATAVAVTFTVTQTDGPGGYLWARPAGTPYGGTSSINWSGAGQNLATTVISALGGDRQLAVIGVTPTHFVIDVTGYYA